MTTRYALFAVLTSVLYVSPSVEQQPDIIRVNSAGELKAHIEAAYGIDYGLLQDPEHCDLGGLAAVINKSETIASATQSVTFIRVSGSDSISIPEPDSHHPAVVFSDIGPGVSRAVVRLLSFEEAAAELGLRANDGRVYVGYVVGIARFNDAGECLSGAAMSFTLHHRTSAKALGVDLYASQSGFGLHRLEASAAVPVAAGQVRVNVSSAYGDTRRTYHVGYDAARYPCEFWQDGWEFCNGLWHEDGDPEPGFNWRSVSASEADERRPGTLAAATSAGGGARVAAGRRSETRATRTGDAGGVGGPEPGPVGDGERPILGGYLYAEPSQATQISYLISQKGAFTRLRFQYHIFGDNIGSLVVETFTGPPGLWLQRWRRDGPQQTSGADAWRPADVAFGVEALFVRFVAVPGVGDRGRMAIAAVELTAAAPRPAGDPLVRTIAGAADAGVMSVAFSPDGQQLVAAGAGAAVRVWDAGTGGLVRALEPAGAVARVGYSPGGGDWVVAAAGDGALEVWDARSWGRLRTLPCHAPWAMAPHRGRLVCLDTGGRLGLWDVSTGRLVTQYSPLSFDVNVLGLSPDGSQVSHLHSPPHQSVPGA